ncbi:hypothetical protein BH11PSE7_BH11PSE7_16400 [soil metagenome]
MQLPGLNPDIRLFGKVSEDMLGEFFRQQSEVRADGPIVLELSTSGGEADMGRRLADELRLWQEQDRELFFLGKTFVYTAGVTVMSAFPKDHRFVTRGCELLIHERKLKKELRLEGALRGCRATLLDVLAEIESGQRLERAGFEQLVKGTPLTVDKVLEQVMEKDWYLSGEQAVAAGLVQAVV